MSRPIPANVPLSAADAARLVARAEFRVFGQHVIEVVAARMWNGRTMLHQARKMPLETYFLSRMTNDANVKVRDGLLDIKVKTGETPEGYEIFQPRGKFQFPVSAADLRTILEHLKVTLNDARETWTIDQFIAAARVHPDLVPVDVEKMRYGFTIDGVICEYAQVWFNDALVESACVESDDHAAMPAVIESLGLSGRPNVNYVRAAKRVVGLESRR